MGLFVVSGLGGLGQHWGNRKSSLGNITARVENELLFEPTTTLLFGDAKDSLDKLLKAVEAL